jgi:chromosomal replication initiator protein
MDKITEACKNKVIAQLRKKLGAARLLIIDDVHSISGKNQIQEEIFYIFTALLKNRAQVILSSDRPPERIARLQQRLVARFHAGSIVALSPPTLKTRVAIIEKKAELLRISIPRKCTALLASRIRTNIRRLEGALTTLAAYSKMGEAPINQELVEEVLRIGLFESDGDALSIHKIQKLVAERFDIKMGSLLGQERSAHFVVPRQLAMYLCRRLLNSSYADIGAAFSGRDHTTALHSCRNAGELVENSSEIRELIDGLITTIGK